MSDKQPCIERIVERVFERMSALYGSKFADLWRGTDIETVKRIWGEKLSGFAVEIIAQAISTCDERPFPPTLPEFIGLCRDAARRVGNYVPSLPAPRLTPEEAARRLDELRAKEKQQPKRGLDPRGWCNELRKRYLSGEKLYPIQISMASEVLGEVWLDGKCNPIAEAA